MDKKQHTEFDTQQKEYEVYKILNKFDIPIKKKKKKKTKKNTKYVKEPKVLGVELFYKKYKKIKRKNFNKRLYYLKNAKELAGIRKYSYHVINDKEYDKLNEFLEQEYNYLFRPKKNKGLSLGEKQKILKKSKEIAQYCLEDLGCEFNYY